MGATPRRSSRTKRRGTHLRLIQGGRASRTTPARQIRPKLMRLVHHLHRQTGLSLLVGTLGAVFALEILLRLTSVLPFMPVNWRTEIQEASRLGSFPVSRLGRSRQAILLPDGPADIIAVGDAQSQAVMIQARDSFLALFANSLTLPYANLSVPNQNPAGYNRLVEVASTYHPRWVVYTLYADDFLTGGPVGVVPLAASRALLSLPGDSQLFIRDGRSLDQWERMSAVFRALSRPFLSLQIAKNILGNQAYRADTRGEWIHGRYLRLREKNYWDALIHYNEPDVQYGVEANAEYVRAVARFAKTQSFHLIVALLPSKEMVYGPLTTHPEDYVKNEHYRTWNELANQLSEQNVNWVELTTPLRKAAEGGEDVYFATNPYLNERGHEIVARALSEVRGN